MGIFEKFQAISIGKVSLASIMSAILTLLICMALARILRAIVKRALIKSRLDDTLKSFIKTAVNAALWVLTIIIVAETLGIPTASLVAVVSVIGLALSLSIQNIMSNLFSGITLLITRPFKAGDHVDIGTNSGRHSELQQRRAAPC